MFLVIFLIVPGLNFTCPKHKNEKQNESHTAFCLYVSQLLFLMDEALTLENRKHFTATVIGKLFCP